MLCRDLELEGARARDLVGKIARVTVPVWMLYRFRVPGGTRGRSESKRMESDMSEMSEVLEQSEVSVR